MKKIIVLLIALLSCVSGGQGATAPDDITPDIQNLADQLLHDPVRIYNYCRNNIDYEHYWGAKKGATLTYLEGSGNDFDTAALMVALLHASGSGYTADYHFALYSISDSDMASWLQLPDRASVVIPFDDIPDNAVFLSGVATPEGGIPSLASISPATYSDAQYKNMRYDLNRVRFNRSRGIPYISPFSGATPYYLSDLTTIYWLLPRVWVRLGIENSDGTYHYYELDASFKHYQPAGVPANLATAAGYSHSTLMNSSLSTSAMYGASTGTGWVQNLNETNLAGALSAYSANLSAWAKANRPDDSVDALLGRGVLIPYYATDLSDLQSLSDITYNNAVDDSYWHDNYYSSIPSQWQPTVRIQIGQYNYSTQTFSSTPPFDQTIPMADLAGQKLSFWFNGNNAHLYLDDAAWPDSASGAPAGNFTLSSATADVAISVNQCFGHLNSDGSFTDTGLDDTSPTLATYKKSDDNTYVIGYGYDADARLLRKRQDILNGYVQSGVSSGDWRVLTEELNIIALTYMDDADLSTRAVDSQHGVLPLIHQRFGRVTQGDSLYVDMYLSVSGAQSSKSNLTDSVNALHVGALFTSAFEHGTIEQTQTGTQAVSTIKGLELANAAHNRIYLADATDWTAGADFSANVFASPGNYLPADLTTIGNIVANDDGAVLAPDISNVSLNSWTGNIYALMGNNTALMSVGSGLHGGDATNSNSVNELNLNLADLDISTMGDAWNNQITPYQSLTGSFKSPEPVDLATGAYTYDKTDLDLGGNAPRGLNFVRDYDSTRGGDNSAGLGYGWTHNYNIYATIRSDPQASLGQITVDQAAPFLAAIAVGNDTLTNPGNYDAQDWLTACLAAKWAIDQITGKSVAITLGDKTIEYTGMPDGSYAPQPGVTTNLSVSGGNYVLSERFGNTFSFNSNNKIASITDPYGKALNFSYDGTTGFLDTITDCYGRSLALTWTGGNITKVQDSTGRAVNYTYDSTGNLTTAEDADSNSWAFAYGGNHTITQVTDPESRTVVQNIYDNSARVIEQLSQGSSSKEWFYYYTGPYNIMKDPSGGLTTLFYDERGRITSVEDPLGNKDLRQYDGQDNVNHYFTPLEYGTSSNTTCIYDENNNLTSVTDPAGDVTAYGYDSDLRLQTITDALSHTVTTFTYNTHNQVLTVADAYNTVLTNTYDSTTGDLLTATDANSDTTTYTYNSLGQVSEVQYPDSTDETFTYNALGDMLTHVDARGNTVSATYNHRREPLVTTLPGSITITNTYDAAANLETVEDGRGNTTTFTYSPSQKPLTATLPAIAAGTPVITNTYDNRDWLASTTDPLSHVTSFSYDAAGQLLAATDPLTHHANLAYDADGRVTTLTDPTSHPTGFAYDARSIRNEVTDALSHNVTYGLDSDGNRSSLTNRLGHTFNFTYDHNNRPLTASTPIGHTFTNTWNSRGLLNTSVLPSGDTTTLTYDSLGRVHTSADPVGTITYGYDNNGNLLTEATTSGPTLTRTYDSLNRVTSYTDGSGNEVTYGYDNNNNLTTLTYPGGKTVNYEYDTNNNLTKVTDWSSRVTTYIYDVAGRLTQINRPNGTSRQITYDSANRVTQVEEFRAGGIEPLSLYQVTSYDNAGRVLTEFDAPIPQAHTEPAITSTFDYDNRLATFAGLTVTHDSNGNMLSGPLLSSSLSTYTYNARDQLTSVGGVSYAYDAEGNLISSTLGGSTTSYMVNPEAPLSQVLVRTIGGVQTYYVYGAGGQLLYEVTGVGGTESYKTYHYDNRGNTAFLVASDGLTITDHAEYSPYGTINYRTGATNTPFLFNGAYGVMTDPSNGLLSMRARFYNPYIQRFVNADPIGFGGGMNWYAFADGDPIDKMDPFGLDPSGDGDGSLLRTGASMGVGFIPVASEVQSWVELISGQDYITGKPTSRLLAAGAIALGMVDLSGLTKLGKITKEVGEASRAAERELAISQGKVFYFVRNQAGGKVWLSTNLIKQGDFKNLVISAVDEGEGEVTILSGLHGTPLGREIPARKYFLSDRDEFGIYLRTSIHNFMEIKTPKMDQLLNGEGNIFCAWCFSENNPRVNSLLKRQSE